MLMQHNGMIVQQHNNAALKEKLTDLAVLTAEKAMKKLNDKIKH